jgi:hypothetical protein
MLADVQEEYFDTVDRDYDKAGTSRSLFLFFTCCGRLLFLHASLVNILDSLLLCFQL